MLLTFGILLVTIALFMSGRFRADGVAMMALLALLLCGLVDTGEALAGFSSGPVMMIAALFVVGAGLTNTGVTHWLGQRLMVLAGSSETRLLLWVMIGTGVLSGFMSNTGVVAMLLPAVIAASVGIGTPPGRVLMPMAYAANLGGLLTMIGTPPNLVVNDELLQLGLEPFGFFTFAIMGVPLLAICAIYMVTIGRRQLQGGEESDTPKESNRLAWLIDTYGLESRFFELIVQSDADVIGTNCEQLALWEHYGIVVLLHRRSGDLMPLKEDVFESRELNFEAGDRLLVIADTASIEELVALHAFRHRRVSLAHLLRQRVLFSKHLGLVEVLIPPGSKFIGRQEKPGKMNREERAQVLAMRRRGTLLKPAGAPGGVIALREGDMALMRASWSTVRNIAQGHFDLVLLGNPRRLATQHLQLNHYSFAAIGILVGMVLLMLSGLVPAVTCTLLAAAAMVLAGCLSLEDGYREINWQSVVLIAAMFPMATAIENTGGAAWLANSIIGVTGGLHPVFLLAGVFLLTSLLSQVISNTASTILLVPIVIATANGMNVSPYPLLMGVAVAASTSLMTPIGTVPNLLVMAPGNYTFGEYVKCGLPLTLLLFAVTLVMVPMIWPF